MDFSVHLESQYTEWPALLIALASWLKCLFRTTEEHFQAQLAHSRLRGLLQCGFGGIKWVFYGPTPKDISVTEHGLLLRKAV